MNSSAIKQHSRVLLQLVRECTNITFYLMRSNSFKSSARGLYGEDHMSSDFPLIFHRYSINLLTGAII